MIPVEIPDSEPWELDSLVLDFNGTLATAGILVPGVVDHLRSLSLDVAIHILTADSYGTAQAQLEQAGLSHTLKQVQSGADKLDYVTALGAGKTAAVGNGRNDVQMLRAARLGIAIIGEEGAAGEALMAADIVCRSIIDALTLLQDPRKLVAVLRL